MKVATESAAAAVLDAFELGVDDERVASVAGYARDGRDAGDREVGDIALAPLTGRIRPRNRPRNSSSTRNSPSSARAATAACPQVSLVVEWCLDELGSH
jgi:hypothetical protein